METRKTQNRIAATINELAEYIRQHAPIKFGELCMVKKIAPSTLYGYIGILLDTHKDIIYEHRTFTVELHHRMPDGKLVPAKK
jgi:hypothetical protein